MASPDELRQAIAQARSALEPAIAGSGSAWEVKPASGEDKDAWSPKEMARHVIGADWFFTNGIAQACGAPAMQRPEIDVETPERALASLQRIAAGNDKILKHVSEGDLSKSRELPIGTVTVEQMLTIMASHANEHAQQIRAASA